MATPAVSLMKRRTGTRPNNRRRSRPLLESLEGRRLLTGTHSLDFQNLQNLQSAETAIAVQHDTLNVGTFNAVTGFFAGFGGSGATDPGDGDPPDPGGGNLGPIMKPPHRPPVQPAPTQAFINAVDVGLIFSVTNRNGAFSVTANGKTVSAAPGQQSLTVEVGTDSQVAYKITAGGLSYSGQFSIVRPPHIAVATIPIIPLAVVYDAPQDPSGLNKTSLTLTSGISTTVSLSYSQGNTTTAPVDAGMSVLSTVKTVADNSKNVLTNIKNHLGSQSDAGKTLESIGNWISDISLGSSIISGLLGSSTATMSDGSTVQQDSSDSVSITNSGTFTPGTHLGPGDGDLICFYQDADIVGIGWNGQVTTGLMPGQNFRKDSVYFLKQRLQALGTSDAPDPLTGLDRTSIQALLALDPQAQGGPNASLDPSRFVWTGNFGENGGTDTETVTASTTQSQTHSSTQTQEYVQTDKSGWLSFLDIGVPDDNTTKVTVTNKTSTMEQSTHTVSATFTLYAGANQFYTVDAYYDTLFGSVLLRKVGPSQALSPTPGAAASEVGGQPVGVLTAAAPQAKTPATSTSTPRDDGSSAATSAPVQLSIRPRIVVSDPTQLPAIPRSKLVLQDAL